VRGAVSFFFGFLESLRPADLAVELTSLGNTKDLRTAVTQVASALKVLSSDSSPYEIRESFAPNASPEPTKGLNALDSSPYAIRVLFAPNAIPEPPKGLNALHRQSEQIAILISKSRKQGNLREPLAQALKGMLAAGMQLNKHESEAHERLLKEESELSTLTHQLQGIRERLANGRTYFARSELAKFCRSHRNRLNPRRCANAVAGLPFIGFRQSATRCGRLEKSKAPGGFRYAIIRVVQRILKSYPEEGNLVSHAKRYLENRRPSPANVFSYLQDKWYLLQLSIQEAGPAETNREKQPYLIASKFFQRCRAPSPTENFMLQTERIVRR
jgi:hypothetical protein